MPDRMLIKVCGLFRKEDIAVVNEAKPDFAGFIVNFPQSHRSIDEKTLFELTSLLDRKNIKAVGVFVNQPVDYVASLLKKGLIDVAQLHFEASEDYISSLKSATSAPVIRSYILKGKSEYEIQKTLDDAAKTQADYPLFDSGMGSGTGFDHSLLSSFSRPFFLAGGISASSILQIAHTLHPFAIDLSSSLETNKQKDKSKILEAVRIARTAYTQVLPC